MVNNYLNICDSENIHWPCPLKEKTENILLNLLDNSKKGTATPSKEAVYADINCEYIFKELKRKRFTLQLLWEEYCQTNPANHYSCSHFCFILKICTKNGINTRYARRCV